MGQHVLFGLGKKIEVQSASLSLSQPPKAKMYTTPFTSPPATSYTLAATFLAFLPFLLHFFSIQPETEPETEPKAETEAEATPAGLEAETEPEATPAGLEPEKNILGSILTFPVSDLEMSILMLLDDIGVEMSTRDMLYHFTDSPSWPHVDRSDLNRCLYRMHEQFIVCMRKENGKPLWSMPA